MSYNELLTPIQDFILGRIAAEFIRAQKFPNFNSDHEGYAVLMEEVDELWEGIKNNKTVPEIERMREAIQIGAMALKYVDSLASSETLDRLCEE